MNPFVEDHPVIPYDTSRRKTDKKFLVEKCIKFILLFPSSELSADDLTTSIYLKETYAEFWSRRTFISSFASIFCVRLYPLYLSFEVVHRDLLLKYIPRYEKKAFKNQKKNKGSSHKE